MFGLIQKKICLLGDISVGKTSLVRRFTEGIFDENYLSTLGVNILRKELMLSADSLIRLVIWDLAGGEQPRALQNNYILGASGALLVCDLTRENTFSALEKYGEMVRRVNPSAPLILLGNKADLVHKRSQKFPDLLEISRHLDAPLLFTSALSGENVEKAFYDLAHTMVASPSLPNDHL